MQIGAINSVNFKGYDRPEVIDVEDFEVMPSNYDLNLDFDKYDKAAELTKKLVDSDDIKGAGATVASVAYAGGKSFAKGGATALLVDRLFNGKPSELFNSALKFGSKLITKASNSLSASEGKKLSTVAKKAGEVVDSANGALKQVYKTITKNVPSKGLAIFSGVATMIALLPGLLKKDNNGDGVADIAQKSQSVYAHNSEKLDKFQEKAGVVAELVQLLS